MRVEPLDPSKHDRKNFDCGREKLNDWLEHSAGQAQEKHNSSRTFILTEDGKTIVGYYALASHAVDVQDVSPKLAKGHSRYPIPAALLARLAVALQHQKNHLGERLLADAVRRIVGVSKDIAVDLIVVDALDDDAARFYQRYEFERWPSDGHKLFAKVKDIAATFGL
jgi:predicted N-acetyltransferase YhbS